MGNRVGSNPTVGIPIQMYQRKTVEHLPVGRSLSETLIISLVVWLRSKQGESERSRLAVRP